jgi:hypothetical protein
LTLETTFLTNIKVPVMVKNIIFGHLLEADGKA